MLQNFLNNKKSSGLILAGLAAFAYYKYSKMSAEEKSKLAKTIREKGGSLLQQIMPGGLKSRTEGTMATAANTDTGVSGSF